MFELFDNELDLDNIVCHSGGAIGSDSEFEKINNIYGVFTKAYSYKTPYHNSINKVEIDYEDYQEGIKKIYLINKRYLHRTNIKKYINLLARNWAQVKYSDQIIAIGHIIKSKNHYDAVDGGTGYAVMMAIYEGKDVFVFDQKRDKWFKWSYIKEEFVECEIPKITSQNFAGIGTRKIQQNGIKAIQDVYKKTFEKEIKI